MESWPARKLEAGSWKLEAGGVWTWQACPHQPGTFGIMGWCLAAGDNLQGLLLE
jgi:hypothetical protein